MCQIMLHSAIEEHSSFVVDDKTIKSAVNKWMVHVT